MENDHDGDKGSTDTFTQDDLNRAERKWKKKAQELETKLAEAPTKESVAELQQKIESMTHDQELHGKSEIEKLQLAHTRELEKFGLKYGQLEDQVKTQSEAASAAKAETHKLRMDTAFGAALSKAGVYGPGANHALKVLMGEVEVDPDGSGAVRGTYGDLIDESPEAIAKKFLEDAPHFAAAKVGGAGTKPPNGQPSPKNLDDLTTDELFAAAGPTPSANQ